MTEDNATSTPHSNHAHPSRLMRIIGALKTWQKIAILGGLAAIIAVSIGMWLKGSQPEYRVLFTGLSDRDGGAIVDSLQQQNIPYKFTEGGGALMVPADKVHELRLHLASQGLPKGGLVGFELMENQKFGTSQFLEQVNYQRALEGELARSIQTLESVQAARVHLALPKPSVFVKEQLKPSASVVLTLYPGHSLEPVQVNGIIHLISSSVADMPAKNVVVLDQGGTVLVPNKEGADVTLDAIQLKYVRQIEQDYVKRVEAIVEPIVGADNVHAQVSADIDFSQGEQTAESFGPNQPPNQAAVRSAQSLESTNSTPTNPAGVPGALSNQPPVPATAPIVSPSSAVVEAAGGNAAGTTSRKEATTNYEVDRTIRYTKLPVGTIKRMSVAVVVNNHVSIDKHNKVVSTPFTEDEKAKVYALVKEAMGFNANRGDSLNVMNSEFDGVQKLIPPEVPLWKQPEMITLAKDSLRYLIIVGIALYLLFGIVRPAVDKLEKERQEEAEAKAEAQRLKEEMEAVEAAEAEEAMAVQGPSYEHSLMGARVLAQNDPKVVAAVIKEWLAK